MSHQEFYTFWVLLVIGVAALGYYVYLPEKPNVKGRIARLDTMGRFIFVCVVAQVGIFALFAMGLDVFGIRSQWVWRYIESGSIDRMWMAFLPLYALIGALVYRWINSGKPLE